MGASKEIIRKSWLKFGIKPKLLIYFVLKTLKLAIGGSIYRLSA